MDRPMVQRRISEFFGGGGGSGQEFFEGRGSGSSKRQVRGNFHTGMQAKNPMGDPLTPTCDFFRVART